MKKVDVTMSSVQAMYQVCDAADLLQTAVRAKKFLDRHDIRQSGPCPTKADTTLRFFTQQ